jgi:hypothetical protein
MVKNLRLLFFWRHYLLRSLAQDMLATEVTNSLQSGYLY